MGIRFLPATKTIPKEMLPIVDKPILLYAVEEIIAADIPELVLIAGRDKTSVEDYFDTTFELEYMLEKAGKRDLLKPIQDLRRRIKVISIRQQEAKGLGHAVLCAEAVIGNEPFALLLSDELMISKPGKPSAIAQLVNLYEKTGSSVASLIEVAPEEVSKYGIVDATLKAPNLWSIHSAVEKPEVGKAPSRLALTGRYVFDSEIFSCLRDIQPDRNGEMQLTDGMTLLAQRKGLLATTIDAERFDARDKLGFLLAKVEMGLRHPEVGPAFKKYLNERFGGN